MLDELFGSSAPFDWDQFLVGDADVNAVDAVTRADNDDTPASAALGLPSAANTPASDASSNTSTPKSTESEQSEVLGSLGLFDFDFPAPAGIVHDPSDILASLQAQATPAPAMTADPMLGNFGSLGDFTSDLQLGNILSQLQGNAQTIAPAATSLPEAYAALGWPMTTPAAETPAASTPVATAMKRKASDSSDDGSVTKRPRGRPASVNPVAKRPYRRQSKNGLSLSQLAAAAASGSPVVVDEKAAFKAALAAADDEEDDDEATTPVRLTSTGKPSTARPKAVVPEKYMKNGEAQAITGMNTEQILSYPNWPALMAHVDSAHRAGAEVFGKMITENRDKAKWAAKKSRDERKAKVESLEGQVDDLNGKIAEMRGLLLGLVGRGFVPLSEVESFI